MRRKMLLSASAATLALVVLTFAFFTQGFAATVPAVATPTLPPTIPPPPGQRCAPAANASATTTPGDGSCGFRLPTQVAQTSAFDQGIPAIKPQTGVTDALTPAISETDVRQYATAHPPQGRIDTQGSVSVVSVQFQLRDQVDPQLQHGLNLPTNLLLSVAKLSGNFVLSGPPTKNPDGTYSANTSTLHTVYYVFDAHTGNLVLTVGAA